MEADLLVAFAREAEAVGARVSRSTQAGLGDVLAEVLAGVGSVVAGPGLDEIVGRLRLRRIPLVCDGPDGGTAAALPGADAGICLALAGVAATGTVLIGPGSGYEGHVAALPPHCVVVVRGDTVYPDLATTLAEAAPAIASGGSRLVFVTGPSRTSDIELTPVVGVHGPLRLDIVIVDG